MCVFALHISSGSTELSTCVPFGCLASLVIVCVFLRSDSCFSRVRQCAKSISRRCHCLETTRKPDVMCHFVCGIKLCSAFALFAARNMKSATLLIKYTNTHARRLRCDAIDAEDHWTRNDTRWYSSRALCARADVMLLRRQQINRALGYVDRCVNRCARQKPVISWCAL